MRLSRCVCLFFRCCHHISVVNMRHSLSAIVFQRHLEHQSGQSSVLSRESSYDTSRSHWNSVCFSVYVLLKSLTETLQLFLLRVLGWPHGNSSKKGGRLLVAL